MENRAKIRFRFFHQNTLRKIVPIAFIKFLLSLNYALLTNLKDTMIVTSKSSGAEAIAVIKGFIILPTSILATIIYAKASQRFNRKQICYSILMIFFFFIFLYGFLLYPNINRLSPTQSAEKLLQIFGKNYAHWIVVYQFWIHVLLFIIAELWGSLPILFLFWNFVNDVTKVEEAKNSYFTYVAAGDIATFFSGPIVYFAICNFGQFSFVYATQALFVIILINILCIVGLFHWTYKYVCTNEQKNLLAQPIKSSSPQTHRIRKPSFRESLKNLQRSKYVPHIAIIVISYGLVINLIEITWKASVKSVYPDPSDYHLFISQTTSYVGLFSFLTALILGKSIINRLGWFFTAQLTPFLIGFSGIFFFALLLNQDFLSFFSRLFAFKPTIFIISFGALQNIVSKVAKYSFFDPTKEMTFIPLNEEEKTKGKASIDIIGSRLGKTSASWIQILFMNIKGTSSVFAITQFLLPIILIAIIFWTNSVRMLSYLFAKPKPSITVAESENI